MTVDTLELQRRPISPLKAPAVSANLWWLTALAAIAASSAAIMGPSLASYLGDTDDATRLIEVRELLANWAWFDNSTFRIGGTAGLISHWSRLIDLPLAALVSLFSLFATRETAELAARAVWPNLVLAPLLYALWRTVSDKAGSRAAVIALALIVLSPVAITQFRVGRIDHHNVMIAATISGAAMMWAYPASRHAWIGAGLLTGLAVAVGYEALAPAAIITVLALLRGLFEPGMRQVSRDYIVALAATLSAAFMITTAPRGWLDVRCDALSLNMVVLALIGAAGAAVALSRSHWPLAARASCAAIAGGAGLAVFGMLEPKCLAGPLGQTPPEIKLIWLDFVTENRSILAELWAGNFRQSLGLLLYFALGVTAVIARAKNSQDADDIFLAVIVATLVLLAGWQFKYVFYASFAVVIPLAVALQEIPRTSQIGTGTLQFAAIILLNQGTLLVASGMVQQAIGAPAKSAGAMTPDVRACFERDAIRDLASLPPALIAANIDLGPYIAAWTDHRALAGPYHRIGPAIIANHHLFAARAADDAIRDLARDKIDYIVTCRALDVSSAKPGTLRGDLLDSRTPAYLAPVPLPNANALFKVWRVNLPPSAAAASAR